MTLYELLMKGPIYSPYVQGIIISDFFNWKFNDIYDCFQKFENYGTLKGP